MKRSGRKNPVQLALQLPTRGGARKGAGRKPNGARAGMPHLRRPVLAARFPVHVTLRMLPHVWNLRSRRSFRIFDKAVRVAADRFGMRLCEFSVQGNHLHLVVEATGRAALSRGLKGLSVRLARGLNKLMGRHGQVLADRYHEHILRTPSEVRRAVHYVRRNHDKHVAQRGGHPDPSAVDIYSSASSENGLVLPAPKTWLLGQGARAPSVDGRG
jgi:REP element-mobilizing transposase RayT